VTEAQVADTGGAACKPIRLFAVHLHREFDRIVGRHACGKRGTAGLQVSPVQWAVNPVENENHTPIRSLDPHLHKALEEGGTVEIKNAGYQS